MSWRGSSTPALAPSPAVPIPLPPPSLPPASPFQPHYSNPLVAAKLLNVPRDMEVVIVCKILADHVAFDNPHDPYEGRVEFKLRIQK